MKKLALILLAIFALSILSGCVEPVGEEKPPAQPTPGPKVLTPEEEEDIKWLDLAHKENDPSYCENIKDPGAKEFCLDAIPLD